MSRGRDSYPPAYTGRSYGQAFHHPSQRTGYRPLSAHSERTLSEKADSRRILRRLRIRQRLQERGHGQDPQSGVHLHGDIRGLQGLYVDDGIHGEDARKDSCKAPWNHGGHHRGQTGGLQAAIPPSAYTGGYKGIRRSGHCRHGRGTAEGDLRKAQCACDQGNGRREAHRRHFRRIL